MTRQLHFEHLACKTFAADTPDVLSIQEEGRVELNAGANTLTISRGWQHYDIDFIELSPSMPSAHLEKVTTPLSTPKLRRRLAPYCSGSTTPMAMEPSWVSTAMPKTPQTTPASNMR